VTAPGIDGSLAGVLGIPTAPALSITSIPLDDPRAASIARALATRVDLLALLPSDGGVAWVRGTPGADPLTAALHAPSGSAVAPAESGQIGLVGWGDCTVVRFGGPERFSRAQRWWADVVDSARIEDEVAVAGSGAVCFASFAFDSAPGDSVVVVPRIVVGRNEDRAWVTVTIPVAELDSNGPEAIDEALRLAVRPGVVPEFDDPVEVTWSDGTLSPLEWESAIATAIERIESGGLDKVVLARDVVADVAAPIDVRRLLGRLASRYPSTWTFSVDGLVGATPELLVRRESDVVTSRVLAGTVRRSADSTRDGALARALVRSDKDQEEHAYAVSSVAAVLAAHCTDLDVPSAPRLLRLANVQHLATDVSGVLADGATALALAASLHPTAAVCGTPTERATALIRELESMDRGRYAGPVGWMDGRGDGEFGIALRCGQIEGSTRSRLRLFAGCGIVTGSSPESELAESQAKLVAMRDALEG